jgi:lysozyme
LFLVIENSVGGTNMPNALVVDLSHHNLSSGKALDFAQAKAAGLVGVIYKASQGAGFRDKTYQQSRKAAVDAGLLWGAYHFGTAESVADQVSNFIATAEPDDVTMLALDFEKNEPKPGNTMAPTQALEFLDKLEIKTGARPTVYTGGYMSTVFGKDAAAGFDSYRVWWAQYANAPKLHATWTTYWLWQYSDGAKGPIPRDVAGIGACDCNHFEGTADDLALAWLP